MLNGKIEFLENMKMKVIQHQAKIIEKKILNAYHEGNYKEVEKLTTQLMELNDKQMDHIGEKMDRISNKIDRYTAFTEKQIDKAFSALEMRFSPSQQEFVKEAMTSEPLSKEDDDEIERILQEIMNNDSKGK